MTPMRAVLILAVLLGLPGLAQAGALAGCGEIYPSSGTIQSYHEREMLRRCEVALAQQVLEPDEPARRSMTTETTREDPARKIPPGLAFVMSAILPGSGQLAEGRRRAFAYLGLEALAWIAHFSWEDAGNKKEGEYEAYARAHWDFDTWKILASGDIDSCLNALPPGVDRQDAEDALLRFLAEGNYQHYYEDIGKLEAYRGGWDDFDCANPAAMSPNRSTYREMRSDSNDYLEKARYARTFAFLNRFVSAIDAYRTARGARLGLSSKTSIELGMSGSISNPGATLRIRRSW